MRDIYAKCPSFGTTFDEAILAFPVDVEALRVGDEAHFDGYVEDATMPAVSNALVRIMVRCMHATH